MLVSFQRLLSGKLKTAKNARFSQISRLVVYYQQETAIKRLHAQKNKTKIEIVNQHFTTKQLIIENRHFNIKQRISNVYMTNYPSKHFPIARGVLCSGTCNEILHLPRRFSTISRCVDFVTPQFGGGGGRHL